MRHYSARELISVLDKVKNKILFQEISSYNIITKSNPKTAGLTYNINLLVDILIIREYLIFIYSHYPGTSLKVKPQYEEKIPNTLKIIEFLLNDDTRVKAVLHDYSVSIIEICKKISNGIEKYNNHNPSDADSHDVIFDKIFSSGTDDEIISIVIKYESYCLTSQEHD